MSNWINVNDRLPNDDQRVMVYGSNYHKPDIKDVRFGYHFANGDFCSLQYMDYNNEIEVTHWQPLPEAPNKESIGNQENGTIDCISSESGLTITDQIKNLIISMIGEAKNILLGKRTAVCPKCRYANRRRFMNYVKCKRCNLLWSNSNWTDWEIMERM